VAVRLSCGGRAGRLLGSWPQDLVVHRVGNAVAGVPADDRDLTECEGPGGYSRLPGDIASVSGLFICT
jgi:hypothetical protein